MISIAAEEGDSGFSVLVPAPYDIVWSLVVFIVVAFFFWKFVIPMFRKVLDEREEQIEGGIRKAEQAQKEAATSKAEHEELLKRARVEAAEIRDQARVEADQIRAERKAELQAELDRQTAAAKAQIEAERQAAIVSLRSEVGTLAVDLASRVVGESLSDDARSTALVDRFLADLDTSSTSGTQN